MFVGLYVCMFVCMYVCMHACMYACIHACVCVCVCVYVCVCARACVCMYACMMYACWHVHASRMRTQFRPVPRIPCNTIPVVAQRNRVSTGNKVAPVCRLCVRKAQALSAMP